VRLVELGIPGAFLVEVEPKRDERGLFARTFDAERFRARGLADRFVQASLSWNERRGTLRGLHWQAEPHGEAKLVRVTRGRIYDLLVDVRPDSHIYRQHLGIELSADERTAIYVPAGVAHGFLTLEDGCEVEYAMSTPFVPEAARGLRWDDPAFGIVLPEPVAVISERDRTYPDLATLAWS
jgi:dTDP-4-dehydrorhamnose 3,5-epimerase